MIRRPPRSTRTDTLFPYTSLFRSRSCRTLRRNRGKRQCECSAELIVNLCSGRQPLVLEKRTHARIENRFGLLHIAIRAKPAFEVPWFDRDDTAIVRSEERRVGKEGVSTCRSWGSPDH